MNKTLFIDESSTEKVDLGDGFWIEILSEISYAKSQKVLKSTVDGEATMKILIEMIVGWNLTEKDGKPAEVNEANIGRLPIKITEQIAEAITPKFSLSKKKSSDSPEPSKEKSE